jgi:molybdopterin-guanine dinucleotide biosynthesis protein A
MRRSAIILAGGSSSRMGTDKGLLMLAGKSLLQHVVDAVRGSVSQIVVVTSSEGRLENYSKLRLSDVVFTIDQSKNRSPLIGAATGFHVADGEYSILLPFDSPFVVSEVVSLLFKICAGKVACIPKHPNGHIEPLHAVYKTSVAMTCAEATIAEGRLDMRGMIEKMQNVMFVSTVALQELDPTLKTFFNVNTQADLMKADALIRLNSSTGQQNSSSI